MSDVSSLNDLLRTWVEITTHRTMRDQARYVRSLGFSMPQFFLLMQVYYRKQCGISDLSEHMEVTLAAASQMVEKLVQAGLLQRAEHPADRRIKQVTLSPKGRELIEKSLAERFRWVDNLVGCLSPQEQDDVRSALATLLQAFQRETEGDR